MCYDIDFEMIRRAYLEDLARRKRQEEQEKAAAKPQPVPGTPAATPARNEEPVPV